MILPTFLEAALTQILGHAPDLVAQTALSGGDINRCFMARSQSGERYFVKLNDAARLPMFEAEAAGLAALAGAVLVPAPLGYGDFDGQAVLVLEYLELQPLRADASENLGRALAAVHRISAPRFGWDRDNTIGTTAQINAWREDWVSFWCEQRLGFQLRLARDNGYDNELQELGERTLACVSTLFADYHPFPSLLHGDLWAGNAGAIAPNVPVVYDPAVYFGDRETDLAMTELFGGFDARFYRAYREAWPLDAGYAVRKTLYNLYHVLNHLNLFGGGYSARAKHMMQQLLSETG